MDAYKYRYTTAARKPPQAWMEINRLWGRCWCGRPKESFERGLRSHCSELHSAIWRNHIRRNWHSVRREVLERDFGACQTCGRSGNRNSVMLDIDHVVPKSLGGDEWNHGNLQALCHSCHEAKTLRDNKLFLARHRSYGNRSITEWV